MPTKRAIENSAARAPIVGRRGRPRRPEPFADWMARIDSQVDSEYRRICKAAPMARILSSRQRRITEMLAEHLLRLPPLAPQENAFSKKEYSLVNELLTNLFKIKYPEWQKRIPNGRLDVDAIPNGEGAIFRDLLRNCGGPASKETAGENEDDD